MTEPTLHVAHVLLRFPSVTETFVHREAADLDGDEMKVRVFTLRRQRVPVLHDGARTLSPHVQSILSAVAPLHLVIAAIRHPRSTSALLRSAWADRPPSFISAARHWGAVLAGFQLASACRRLQLHHIHAAYAGHTATTARIASRLVGIPYSCTAHAHDIFNPGPGLEKRIRDATFVRCVTEFNRRYLLRLVKDCEPDRLRVIRCAVDLPASLPLKMERSADAPLHLLTVAQMRPYKALDVLVDAIDILRWRSLPVRATIAGAGPQQSDLETRAQRCGVEDKLVFQGPVRQDRLGELHGRADIFVATGRMEESGKMDGFPVALLEAMAAGLPIVATRISGVPELVRHGVTGLLVPPGDAGALAEAIEQLASNPEMAARLAAAGRNAVQRHCDPAVARKHLRASVLASHGQGLFPDPVVTRIEDHRRTGARNHGATSSLRVRRLCPTDRDAVVDVLARTWGPAVARDRDARWDWLHVNNPHHHPGGSPAFVLENDDRVVGCMLGVAAPLWWDGQTLPIAWVGASAVLPAYRGRGRRLLDQTRESLGTMSGVPTPRMARLWARVDRYGELWQGPVRALQVRPLGPGAGASFRFGPFESKPVTRFDASWDHYLHEWTASWHATLARSRATCNWLLLDDPAAEQSVVGILRKGKPAGYVAIRFYNNERGERRATVADLLAARGDISTLRAGLTAAMGLARSRGASALTLREPMHRDHRHALRGLGFLDGRSRPLPLVIARAPGSWSSDDAWWQLPDIWADPRIF